ncbi:MAG TPA: MobF family relaxase [Acidimicrobiia bacterium]|nr:MobF family relaxase [Acidimicrobiia bacterium]
MLNVAVIRSVAYYLDQVAPSRAAYYVGRGEAPGRWRGALAASFGLRGRVDPDALRPLLEGRNPATGEPFLPSGRPVHHREGGTGRTVGSIGVDVAAAALGVSPRTVRRWATAGEAAWSEAQEATPDRTLRTAGEVQTRLEELGSATLDPGTPTCLLVPPAAGRRRRFEIPAEEVERLRQTRRAPSTRQGYDVVFRPAKGWSVLWAVGPPEVRRELRRIHHRAVDDALAYLEDTAARGRATVVWRDRRVRIRARGEGFVAACFDHRESRASDPLMHTHCLIANVTRLPDGRLGSLEASSLFRQQRAADAVYRATFLRLAAERLGIRPAGGDDPFPEPEGVPRSVIDHFSKRSDEISEEVARHGSATAAARQLAALATRRAKEVAARSEDLHRRWRREAEGVGFSAAEVEACLGRPPLDPPTAAEIEAVEAALAGPVGLTERAATFGRGDAVRALADAFPGRMTGPETVRAADDFLASHAVIQVREHRPGRPRGRILEAAGVVDDPALSRFSVPAVARAEARLMAAADRDSGPVLPDGTVAAVLIRFPNLSPEQVEMVRAVSHTTSLLRPVVGLPGSGKTTATAALVAACQAAAVPVVGCAVTATAADELQQRTGLAACDTLARLLLDLQAPDRGLARGTLVVADEASMLPTRELDRLVAHVETAGGAVVLIGDPHQHPAVGPGSFFTWLTTHRPAPTLTGNLRQIGDTAEVERQAAAALRRGDVAAAIDLRDAAGLLTRASTPAELHQRLVGDWQELWAATRDPMIAASNDTRRRLNAAARALLHEAGIVHGPVWRTRDGVEFQAGDWVVARHNDRRLRAETDPAFWVRNGACGDIVAVDPHRGEVVVDFAGHGGSIHRIRLPGDYVDAHVEHGYALTDYGVQGRTLSRALAVLDEAGTTPGLYVATTRGRQENRLYLATGNVIDPDDLDVSHGIPRVTAPSLQELTARIAARRPEDMLHDRDPNVGVAARLAEMATAPQLRSELRDLDGLLDTVPNDQAAAIRSALRARNRLAAGNDSSGSSRLSDEERKRRIARLDHTIERIARRQRERVEALRNREAVRVRRAMVADAIAIRTFQDRLAGRPRGHVAPETPASHGRPDTP